MKFASFRNARVVRSDWLEEGGRRLDCNPYMSGALEARDALRLLSERKDKLADVTTGIFDSGRESRSWVDDRRYGVPFMGSSAIGLADLSTLPLISKKQVERNPRLLLKESWSLITRSGTIGRMAYVRPDMAGMACSEDVLRVVPDESKILPGYLYAFLSSKYGVPLVVAGTYGAIIQHIEPEHIANLPVPRFGHDFERKVDLLVAQAANKRDKANYILREAISELISTLRLANLRAVPSSTPFSVSIAPAVDVQYRLDAFFHSSYHRQAIAALESSGADLSPLRSVVTGIEEPNRFKRIVLDGDTAGIPLFGTSAIFWNDPEPSYRLPSRLAAHCIVSRKTLLVPRSGQLSGVIGRTVLPYGRIIGGAVSEDAIRIHCHSEEDAGFLFVFLSCECGIRQLKARAFGTSIPHLDVRQIGDCTVLARSHPLWKRLGHRGLNVSALRSQAIDLENLARKIVEAKIKSEED
ncbi:MAG: restriction endonuclease subunit S [Candidatus Accumulibacter phosphatis]|jgi:type I restriction enzyme S subunit|uniref:methylation-associated defense system restriction endonuclease subunit S MAD5 n=1 Tax=Candidatus Accumulibacter TaxID=327159 RepID=UPI001A4E9A51|nr:restriction endonuclease subunit S [Accumulibacter sp.]MBL8408358.1 restriction endonuclease subunit S [Accumulibacter sp.]HRF13756.1 restriction endonuclease subunit S [Candidatus Accumulibacter phosphatis]